MSLIVRVLEKMDQQLADTLEGGMRPDYFVLRAEEWAEIVERFKFASDASTVSGDAYKGVPVKFGDLGEDDLVVLVEATRPETID